MELVRTPSNPIPEGCEVSRITARDGAPLRVAYWRARRPDPHGTVCIMQGRAEFIEKYAEVVGELLERGFAVVAFDWRGQGGSFRALSDPKKGHVRSFKHYRRDVEAVNERILQRLCPGPFFGLAHSMGGAIALDLARIGALQFSRLVITAPMLGLMIPKLRRSIIGARVLYLLGMGGSYIPGGGATSVATKPFAGNPLTSDRVRYERNAEIAASLRNGAIGDPTIGWSNAAFRHMQRLAEPRAALDIRIPTLIVAAGSDTVCDTRATERFGAGLKGGGVIVIPGARHEILMERDAIRGQFWAAFDAFIPGSHVVEALAASRSNAQTRSGAERSPTA
jgi:lysophospholipase